MKRGFKNFPFGLKKQTLSRKPLSANNLLGLYLKINLTLSLLYESFCELKKLAKVTFFENTYLV